MERKKRLKEEAKEAIGGKEIEIEIEKEKGQDQWSTASVLAPSVSNTSLMLDDKVEKMSTKERILARMKKKRDSEVPTTAELE